jgi:spore coat polysaccharide biosynthesis protein SpsF (cytidylyltransferase family)/RimJ/RimL family protein N-acetyltransferase
MNTQKKPINLAIVQARMTSSRLPGKVLSDICGKPSLQRMLERINMASSIDKVVVATTINASDDLIVELCERLKVDIFRGDEDDVLGRFCGAAEVAEAEIVIRLTADCPMIDPDVIDEVVSAFSIYNHDYLSNTIDRTYPDGLDIEVMSIDVLREAHKKAVAPFLREHVTPYISGRRPDLGAGDFRVGQIRFVADFSHIRWTLDTKEDLQRIRSLVSKLPEDYRWLQALSIATQEPDLLGNMIDGQTTEVLSLRLAVASDVKLLFEWVNTPSSLKNKEKSSTPIEWSAHQNWFNKRLNNPNVRIWIVERNKQAIGQVRVEYDNNKLLIDIFIDSLFKGNDYGLKALKLLIKQCQVTYPGVPLHAIIKNENYPSLNLFRRADFQEVSSDGHGHMSYFIYTNSNNIVEKSNGI